jgi:hypothetical protein
LRIEGVAWSAQRFTTVVNLGFLDRIRIRIRNYEVGGRGEEYDKAYGGRAEDQKIT